MNPTKTKYARERAQEILNVHCKKVEHEYGNLDYAPEYSNKGKNSKTPKDLTRDVGKAIKNINMDDYIKSWCFSGRYGYRNNQPEQNGNDFEDIIKKQLKKLIIDPKEKKRLDELKAKCEARIAKIRDAHDKCMDIVVLGDEATALTELNNFVKGEF